MHYRVNHISRFTGIDGRTYRLQHFNRDTLNKFELYLVDASGLELFVGYLTKPQAQRAFTCERCAASAFQPCWATGMVTSRGSLMQSNHASRRNALRVVTA